MMGEKTTAEVLKDWLIRTRGYYLTPKEPYHRWIAIAIAVFCVGALIYSFVQ
jgi:hypothetical protein